MANKNLQSINIKTDEKNPQPVELIAESIIEIAAAFQKINSSRLNKRAIILLLHDAIGTSKIGKKEIELVLDYAPKLAEHFINKK